MLWLAAWSLASLQVQLSVHPVASGGQLTDAAPLPPASLPNYCAANYALMQLAPALGSFGLAMGLAGWLYEVGRQFALWEGQGRPG